MRRFRIVFFHNVRRTYKTYVEATYERECPRDGYEGNDDHLNERKYWKRTYTRDFQTTYFCFFYNGLSVYLPGGTFEYSQIHVSNIMEDISCARKNTNCQLQRYRLHLRPITHDATKWLYDLSRSAVRRILLNDYRWNVVTNGVRYVGSFF